VETIENSPTDTLSDIALQVRPDDSVTLEQTMLALQQENPQAFDDDNINNLRSGEVLRVPTLAEIQAIDPREALTEVNRQNQEFAQVDVEPLVAPDQTTPDQPAAEQGQLSVVSADDSWRCNRKR
jgi:pilus assembly protein FimV